MADETTTTTENTTNNNQRGDEQPTDGNQMTDEQKQLDQEALQSRETVTTTVVSPEVTIPQAEKQGEVAIDKEATADVVGGNQVQDENAQDRNIAQAKADALVNHAAHEASQPSQSNATDRSETAAE